MESLEHPSQQVIWNTFPIRPLAVLVNTNARSKKRLAGRIHFLTAHACWPRVCFYVRNASISPQPMMHVSLSSLHCYCKDVSWILRRHLDGCSCYSTRSRECESVLYRKSASTPPPRGFGYIAVIDCCNMHDIRSEEREWSEQGNTRLCTGQWRLR